MHESGQQRVGPPRILSSQDLAIATKEFVRFCPDETKATTFAMMANIEKALRPKIEINPKEKLPKQYQEWLKVFDHQLVDQLPPHRLGIDHRISLTKDNLENKPSPPWRPLYGMNREELLLLRKIHTKFFDK